MKEVILNELYKELLNLLLIVLIPALITAMGSIIRNELLKHKIFKNTLVQEAVITAVHTVEQLDRTGKLKGIQMSGHDKFEEALNVAASLLQPQGIKIDTHALASRIEAAVYSEINSQVQPFLAESLTTFTLPEASK